MIPCCFHPTQVVVVDDNREFLCNLDQILSSGQASYRYFTSPEKALYYLNKVYRPNPFPNRYIENRVQEDWKLPSLDVNIFDAYHEVYRPERFEEISVVIADQSMPGMSGLRLCRQIQDPHIQKILLTGVADEHIAIRAFNEGIIHHYIRKQDLDMHEQLNEAVEKAQWRYFNRLSEVATQAVVSSQGRSSAVGDPQFQILFKKVMKQQNFREAFLCEVMGSYVFLTEEGKPGFLVVNDEEQLKDWVRSGELQEVDPFLLQELRDQKKIICYCVGCDFVEPEPEEWAKHAQPLQALQGARGTYYYALASDAPQVDLSRVLSFEKYKAGKVFEIQD